MNSIKAEAIRTERLIGALYLKVRADGREWRGSPEDKLLREGKLHSAHELLRDSEVARERQRLLDYYAKNIEPFIPRG